jgi:hypothetical protein
MIRGLTRRVAPVLLAAGVVLGLGASPVLALDPTPPPEAADPGRGTFFYNPDNGHWYEVVATAKGTYTWQEARDLAAGRTIFGGSRTGYLATITSEAENLFVLNMLATVHGGFVGHAPHPDATDLARDLWIGASDSFSVINAVLGTTRYADQAASEGRWYWVTGPEAGRRFWQGGPEDGAGESVSGRFAAWSDGEPNDRNGNEHFAVANYLACTLPGCSTTRSWNDYVATTVQTWGLLIEYGPEETPAPAGGSGSLQLDCTPDPAAVGATVTCRITGADSGIDILWSAAGVDGRPFAQVGVTIDGSGNGVFTFVVPAGTGERIDVELVGWGVNDAVGVQGVIVPAGIPAGPGEPEGSGSLALLILALTTSGLLVGLARRRSVAA